MKKLTKLALCGLAAMIMVAGCSKKEPEQEPATTAAAAGDGTVVQLGTYKGVEIDAISTEVTDEEVDSRIQSILAANPEYVEISDRAAQNGDMVDIDYVGMKDGVAFDGGTAEGYKLELGSGSFIDGFEDGLVGANVGDELSLNLTFPEEYHSEELAGQAVVFDVTVNGIEEVKDAVLDENFVQRMSDFTTVEEFQADIRADLESEKAEQAEIQMENAAFAKVMDTSDVTVVQAAVDKEYDTNMQYYNSMTEMYGMTLSDFAAMYQMTEEEFETQIRSNAEESVKVRLVVAAIAEAENIAVTDADRQAIADDYGMDLATMQSSGGEEEVDRAALMYKVMAFVRENAIVKE